MENVRRFTVNPQLLPGLITPKQYKDGKRVGGGDTIAGGAEVTEEQLAGVNIDALIQGGLIQEGEFDPILCAACQEDAAATKKAKATKFANLGELRAHYMQEHPALAPPEEV